MGKTLVIVESPAKSKKISSFLGSSFIVDSSVGHIRDLPLPRDMSETELDKYGVYAIDVKASPFEPLFKVDPGKVQVVKRLAASVARVDKVVLATDPDREGEAISWHLLQTLAPVIKKHGVTVERATWTEITPAAVQAGLAAARKIDQHLVDAALSRALYDRLFGFSMSSVVRRVMGAGTTAGRVQSPALRLVVDREKERLNFVRSSYMSVVGTFGVGEDTLTAKLISIGARKMATGSSFGSDGKLKGDDIVVGPPTWNKFEGLLKQCKYAVGDVTQKPYKRNPGAPYTTSTFQQDVGTRLGIGNKVSMDVAQKLYNEGLISYMRTDSPGLSEEAETAARKSAVSRFGSGSIPAKAPVYKGKKGAQEGHEAIRPTVDKKTGLFPDPTSIKSKLDSIDAKAYRIYELVYNRTVASQMNPAVGFTTTVKIVSTSTAPGKTVVFSTAATVFTDQGFMALMRPTETDESESNSLNAKVEQGQEANLKSLKPETHSTNPPPRFTEPKLTAVLDEMGIGRPSTFATIVTVNQERGYLSKKGNALYPTWKGMQVAQYLEAKAGSFVAYEATAKMEEDLDLIEQGKMPRQDFLTKEWGRIESDILPLTDEIDWDEVHSIGVVKLPFGLQVRVTKSACWLEDGNATPNASGFRPAVRLADNQNVAEIDFTDREVITELMSTARGGGDVRELGVLTGGTYAGWSVSARTGKFGPYVMALSPEAVAENEAYVAARAAAKEAGEKPPARPDTKVKSRPVIHNLPDGLEISTVEMADVAGLFDQVKLPRHLSTTFFVGVSKNGSHYIGHKASASAKKAEFMDLPEEHDPRTVTLAVVQKLWRSAHGGSATGKAGKGSGAKTERAARGAKKTAAKKTSQK